MQKSLLDNTLYLELVKESFSGLPTDQLIESIKSWEADDFEKEVLLFNLTAKRVQDKN